MTRDEAKEYVKQQQPTFLTKAKRVGNQQSYVCPECGNGSGKDGTGIILNKKSKAGNYKCFTCGMNKDIISLWKAHTGIQDDKTAFNELYQYYGITIDQTEEKPAEKKKATADQPADQVPTEPPKEADQTAFFLAAAANIENTDYHRGITLETLKRFKVGFIENWKHPKRWSDSEKRDPFLIVPISNNTYLARYAGKDHHINFKGLIDDKLKVKTWEDAPSENWLFNRKAIIRATQPIVVVEGEIDALSIIDAGGEAVGLGCTAMVDTFLKYVEEHKPAQPLILSLDNDKKEDGSNPGKEAEDKLAAGLTEQGIVFYRHNIAGDHKDANEALQADRAAFTREVAAAREIPAKDYRSKTAAAAYMQAFVNGIAESANTPPISTGFSQLDTELDGGLYEGLYTIGAISSLGKTALIMQMADQIAAAGHDVLIISLEMARTELMARSISRHTIIDCIATGEDTRNAKTVRGITDFSRWSHYSEAEKALIKRSMKQYESYADRLFIVEGVGDIGVNEIREDVKKHADIMGKPPVVIVDYLQLLAPANDRASDKQNTDKAILELKRISRDYKTPVIAISSFNRMNYSAPAAMEAFKESGAIEYSSDVLFGMQLEGVGSKDFDLEKAKKEDPRKIELVILKNRNGRTGGKISFDYYAMFNYYSQGTAPGWEGSGNFKRR